ncbi:eukaryotic translation initiation factor 4 gamma 3-like isoform X1 [Silurus meridionalis]|uniref:eukaryotic translation initiation factor 4 gamma 3-like isoform X1 n=1 Tax=Silurus meridionalis TaxID=175797 RepID=UPI001EEC22A6|nr:eukaryotic translation initiation factor 4 gamma 3-like isoform X1 [Silurus meridionalis]
MSPTSPWVFSSHETMNTVSMNITIDPNKIPKINKLPADDKIYLGSNFGGRRLNWKNGCDGETSARATSGASVKLDAVPDSTTNKPALSEEEMEKRSKSIIEEFLHINDYKEASHCVEELDQGGMLDVVVRSQKEVEALWRDSKLSWADFLPETVDGNNFITEQP